MAELEPDTTNVLFMDEYPQYIERRQVKEALGQLVLDFNTNPGQLLIFTPREDHPDVIA